jgi:excisionase family DNA binding protein
MGYEGQSMHLAAVEQLLTAVVRRELSNRVEQGYFSIKQAAAYTALSGDHVRRAVKGGTLPVSNVGTPDRPLYRISRSDLDAFMRERQAGPKPPP